MIEAMAQSRRNFCRRKFPRRGGAYYVGRIRCERGEWLEKRRW